MTDYCCYTLLKFGLLIICRVVAGRSLNDIILWFSSVALFLSDFGIKVMVALGSISIENMYFESSAELTNWA